MFGQTPLVLVETPESLADCVSALSRARVIGVDTESDSMHHYREKVCLVQVSDLHTDFVIDPLAVDLAPLGAVLASRDIVKVFHGADYDVVCLKRDFGFELRNIFDTMIASQFLGLPRIGLADLVGTWWGVELDKKWQRHDWAARPLLDEHLEYARGDSHWLPALRDILLRRLSQAGRLAHVLEECAIVEAREWVRPRNDPGEFWRVKGSKQLDATGQRVLRALFAWRDGVAAAADRPVYRVLPEEILLEVAQRRPESTEALAAAFRRNAPFVRRFGDELVEAVLAGLADTEPLPQPPEREPRVEGGLRGLRAERLMAALKSWRNHEVETRKLPPVAVASNTLLKNLTRQAPRTREEIESVEEIRTWQKSMYGDTWVGIVNDVLGRGDAAADTGDRLATRRRRRRGPRGGSDSAPGQAE
ncbi:MAG: ribonuclease D [Deltaproteobacteria bacterium]|nr:ribonuclease D [Deltaproteobacteria bacterium]